jgi:hypothetical protein
MLEKLTESDENCIRNLLEEFRRTNEPKVEIINNKKPVFYNKKF